MSKQPNTYIAILLDESGSMGALKSTVIDAFNSKIETIKDMAKNLPVKLSLITFNSVVKPPVLWMEDASKVDKITSESYEPNGSTALNDAVGHIIEEFQKVSDYNDPDTAFLVTIISDGEENFSKKWPDSKALAERIQDMQNTKKWTFTYIGADIDLAKISKQYNIPIANTMAFVHTAKGYADTTDNYKMNLRKYSVSRLAGDTQTMAFFDPEDKS